MKLKATLMVLFLCLLQSVRAQSPARQIKDIQKNTTEYINAESTDPDEAVARKNAMRQMIDMARNFVSTNNNGADISDLAIDESVKSIVIPRGDFKRVFLYASRADLLQRSGGKVTAAVKKPAADIVKDDTETDPSTLPGENMKRGRHFGDANTNRKDRTAESETEFVESTDGVADLEDMESDEEFVANIPLDIKDEVISSVKISSGMKEMISLIQNSGDLKKAAEIIYRYKNRNMVSDYGSPRESHNSAASYWVVEDNGIVTVLGPEVRGHRNNFRTGQPDALHRYDKGIWFRKR